MQLLTAALFQSALLYNMSTSKYHLANSTISVLPALLKEASPLESSGASKSNKFQAVLRPRRLNHPAYEIRSTASLRWLCYRTKSMFVLK